MTRTVIDNCAVVTMDADGTEHAVGHVVLDGPRIASVGAGTAARSEVDGDDVERIDARGCLVTPGLVNTHHHLYQWITRGLGVDDTLFDWLTHLYPVWAGLDEDTVHAAATGALGWLARTGCTTSSDHHYIFPTGGGDQLGATIDAAAQVGLRFFATRGSMDLGESSGGLPPDRVVEDLDAALAAGADAVERHHDPAADSVLRVGLAPCSPFSVTSELFEQSARLARELGVRMHTHLAETVDEEQFCRERFGCSPVEYVESRGWLGPDVWLAHVVHLDDAGIERLAATRTGVAHCPSSNGRLGAGMCRTPELRAAGVPVGLGVDGAASNEAASLVEEMRHALLFGRARKGPGALGVREALQMATIEGARLLGWDDQIGSLEVGKLADVALWRLDTLPHAGIEDPVAALVLGAPPPLELLLVQGRAVVRAGRLVTVDEDKTGRAVRSAQSRLLQRAGVTR